MDPITSIATLSNIYDPQKAAEIAAYGDAMQGNRLANRVREMQLKEMMRGSELQKLVGGQIGANMLAPQLTAVPAPVPPAMPISNTLMPPSALAGVPQPAPAAPPIAGNNLLNPQPAPTMGPLAPPQPLPTAVPAPQPAPDAGPSMLQRQLTAFKDLRENNKIDDYEYGKLVTEAVTANNQQAGADLEQFGKLTEMVKKGGGPAKFGTLVNSGFFDGIAPPETLKKLKSIDYSKMKEEADFTEYELPSGGKLVSGRDSDGKPFTHVLPNTDKTLTAEQLTAKSLEEKLGRKPTFTEIKTAMETDKEKTNVPAEVKTFEIATGMKPEQRGTKAYKDALLKWDKEHKTALHVVTGGTNGDVATDFKHWDKPTKQWWFENMKSTGQKPDFGWGKSAAASRAQFSKEYAQWAQGKGITGVEAGTAREDFKANSAALRDLTKREQLIGTFTHRIDATSKVVIDLAKKYQKTNSKLLNMPINSLAGLVGSGDLQALRLALKSLSNEVAKVESGSLGIAEVSVEQGKYMEKVHDVNLSLNDMIKVIDTGKALGKTNMESIGEQRKLLKVRMSGSGNAPPPAVMDTKPPAAQHSGKILYGHGAEAGKKWKSNGREWVEVR